MAIDAGSSAFLLAISDFSMGEGVYLASHLLKAARELGYSHIVLWDRGLQGYPKLRMELEWANQAVSMGAPHFAFDSPGPTPSDFRIHFGSRFTWRGFEIGALPHSDAGYAALNKLLTDQTHGRPGELPQGCTLLADTLAGLDQLLREGCYATLLAHPCRAQEARRALALGLPVVAPQVLRFRTPEGLELHRLKRAIHDRRTLLATSPLWELREAAMPRAEWEARFPWAEPAIAKATQALLERIQDWNIHWGGWINAGPLGVAGDLDAILRERVLAGLRTRYDLPRGDVESRLEHELQLIRDMKFASYFLLVEDLVKASGIKRICGRGSGAASLVSYALGLSNVDPIATNLMFERFLTLGRKDPPDMDIDFAWDERDAVIQMAFERYGRDRVAMVSNHVFFKRRSALRQVAMAYGRPEAEMKAMKHKLEGWDGGLGDVQETDPWFPILRSARALDRHFQQFSVHPGGIVLTPGPLWEHVAFQPAPAKENVSVTCWDKEGIEGYGLVKIDLLGNRSLAVIRDAYDALHLPMTTAQAQQARTDPETQALLARGDSIGVFYVESPATRQLQQRVGKGDFETLVIHSSLIRPAANRWIDRYVKRVRGEETYVPTHPAFANLLSESFGVLVYQEDIIKVGMELAGWTYQEADQLRKTLGKYEAGAGAEGHLPKAGLSPEQERRATVREHGPEGARPRTGRVKGAAQDVRREGEARLALFEARFRAGCASRGIAPAVVDEAWDMVRTFRGYSFCKPHSASYAQVSFESAWIKAHHPAHFFASVITNQGGFYPAIAYLGDARRHRIVVRGPDVNASAWAFRAESGQALRVGLMQVQGAREAEVRALIAEREAHGPFEGPDDLLARVKLSLPTVEALCAGGAFDAWAPDGDRTRLLWTPLGGVPAGVRPRPTDPFDRADQEMDVLSLTLEIHPAALARFRKSGGPHRVADAEKPGRRLNFWALVVAEKRVLTEKGDSMQFITFEDETGLCEAVAFPQAFARRRRPFRVGDVLPVRGTSTRQDGLCVLEVE